MWLHGFNICLSFVWLSCPSCLLFAVFHKVIVIEVKAHCQGSQKFVKSECAL